jgi:hypothetical protein
MGEFGHRAYAASKIVWRESIGDKWFEGKGLQGMGVPAVMHDMHAICKRAAFRQQKRGNWNWSLWAQFTIV